MNNDRRKALAKWQKEVAEMGTLISEAAAAVRAIFAKAVQDAEAAMAQVPDDLSDLQGEVESLRDEEQEYYDNMPEGLQGSERGEQAQEAVNNMEECMSKIEEASEALAEFDLEAIIEEKLTALEAIPEHLEEAGSFLEEAQS